MQVASVLTRVRDKKEVCACVCQYGMHADIANECVCQYGMHADIANECVRGQLTERVESSSSGGPDEPTLPSAPAELISAYGYVISVACVRT